MRSQSKIFARRVEGFMQAARVCVKLGTSCGDAVDRMRDQRAGTCLVVDTHGKLAGVLSLQGVLEKLVFQVGPHMPVEDVMEVDVQTIYHGEYLYQAIARMRRYEVDEIVVVDHLMQPQGIINYQDAIEAATSRLIHHIDRLGGDGNLESLRGIKAAQADIARDLFEDNVSAGYIQRLLSHVNSDIVARLINANLAHLAAEGWGDPPVAFCAIVMGSGGRGENYLYPDQDNGFILDDYPDEDHNRVDHFFRELATRLCDDLNAIGIPYCPGNVMASNPVWRKTLSQWKEQVRLWGRKRNVTALRLADIFFDYQPVWGKMELAEDLRRHVLKQVRENHFFLQEMFHNQADHAVALGLFGRLAYDIQIEDKPRAIDLKYGGTLPLVEAIRLMSLRHGLSQTATQERIQKLHHVGVLSDTEADYLASAFGFLTRLLLSRQVQDFREGVPASRFVSLNSLSKREKESLQNALRHIAAFRKRLKAEFTGDVF